MSLSAEIRRAPLRLATGAGLAGLALTGFACGLIGLYARTPGLRREGSVFPTQQGIGFAKDTWLAAMGISLLADAVLALREGTSEPAGP
jgi:hypothetical protein